MSIRQMGLVWEHEFDRAEQAVMLAIADHADHDGESIYPSMARVAWKTGYSKRHVIRIVGGLREKGVLVLVRDADPINFRPSEYRIDWTKAQPKVPFRAPSDTMSPGDTDVTPLVTPCHPPSDTDVTPLVTQCHPPSDIAVSPGTVIEPSDKPPDNHDDDEPSFRDVVRAYENNIGTISHRVSELIADACEEFGGDAVIGAINIAAENNVRKWAYVDAILGRWRVHGRQEKKAVHTPEQSEDGGYYV